MKLVEVSIGPSRDSMPMILVHILNPHPMSDESLTKGLSLDLGRVLTIFWQMAWLRCAVVIFVLAKLVTLANMGELSHVMNRRW